MSRAVRLSPAFALDRRSVLDRCSSQRRHSVYVVHRPRLWTFCDAMAEATEGSIEEETAEVESVSPVKKKRGPVPVVRKKRSKRYSGLTQSLSDEELSPMDAINSLKEMASAKFDETVELHGKTLLDPRYADQQLRATGAVHFLL